MELKRYKLLNDGGFGFLRDLKFPVVVQGYEYLSNVGNVRLVWVKGIHLRAVGAKSGWGGWSTEWNFVLGAEAIPFEE